MGHYLDTLAYRKSPVLDKVIPKIEKMHERKMQNKDHLKDYYQLLNNKLTNGIFSQNSLSQLSEYTRVQAGIVHVQQEILPFEKKSWEHLVDNRNKIEHRDQFDATLEDSHNTLGCLALLLRENATMHRGPYDDFSSDVFHIESRVDVVRF